MSYSSSGAVATLWSPSNYSGTTKMPVPSTTTVARRYPTTSGTASFRTTGTSDRSYLSSTGSYASRSIQTEQRTRYTPSFRSSTSMPSSYSRYTDIHETTSRIGSKDRSEANDTGLLSYTRSKTDNDVSATRERYGLKSESYKLRSDTVSSRFLNTPKIELKYQMSKKTVGGATLDLPRYSTSSVKTSKTSEFSARLQRKDSLTRSEDSSGLGRSFDRKHSTSGGSSSPIEIRKSSEVWNKRLSGSYESAIKGSFESDLLQKIDNNKKGKSRDAIEVEDLSDSSIILENIESEEKALSFEEIRRKFDKSDSCGGFESSCQKSSHSKDLKTSISNGVILGVQFQYFDRKCKKLVDNSVDGAHSISDIDQLDTNNSFPSSQTLHGSLLKHIPGNLKTNGSTNAVVNNNNPAFTNSRVSPDPVLEPGGSIKKRSLPDLKKAVLSPEKKELKLLTETGLEHKCDEKETRRKTLVSTLVVDNRNELKVQPKKKGEKLLTKLEQSLSKTTDTEMMTALSRIRRSPEGKPKNETVIELRRIEPPVATPLEKDEDQKQKSAISDKPLSWKEPEVDNSPVAGRKEANHLKPKKCTSLKDEKETNNVREREMNKRLLTEEPPDLKTTEEKPDAEEHGKVKESDKTESSKNNRNPFGSNAYQSPNSFASDENLENAGIHGTSPKPNLGWSKNSGLEKGGLNGLRNIGNTCFMNSVIQCLSNTKPLLEYLLNEDYLSDINTTISGMKGALIKAFSNVIQELWAPNAEDKIINTTNFKSQIQKFAPRFMGYSQQDAQEFLRYLLEGLHEDVNRVTAKPKPITTDIDDTLSDNQKAVEAWKRYLRMDDSKVVDIFVGQLKSTLQCTVCGHCSVTFDPFWDLSLPVPNRNSQLRLSSCLDAFTKEEVLDGDEKPTCFKCKTRRKCTKSFSIQKFPKILVLHLKRFSPTERYRGKLSVTVEFPLLNLDLSPYAANRGQSCMYNLYAISNHSGTAFNGHYTAYCKHPYTGNWHEYNDSGVSSLSSRSVVSGEAYVLFYELAAQTSHL